MWIVKVALRHPYTFAVMALLILILGVFTISRMATDVLPEINIPVVTVIWSYGGFTPNDIEKRFVNISERAMTTTVSGIEHIESQSVSGVGLVRIYFQPGADLSQAIAQVTATAQQILRVAPPGTQPPLIIRYDASDVPIIEASIGSNTESEASLYDYASNFIRTQLVTIKGAAVPTPYGGKSRSIQVDLDPQALYAAGLSPTDVSNAIAAQNLVLPTGDMKMGNQDYPVLVNSSATVVDQLNDLPIKEVNGAIVTVRQVAQVRDGYTIQTNIADRNSVRSVLLTILKSNGASTLSVVSSVKSMLTKILQTVPADLKVTLLDDQSIFVRASIQGVVTEATIAACLTATMILLFLGSLRSTFIVAVSIPLSILCSILILGSLGETLNTMTLGGLALAVGMLVDDTTVEIENINRNLSMGKPLKHAILDGAAEIAVPALYSTLGICIVFLPVWLLSGVAHFLFVPLAEAVIFAMLASYLLSRTVTPTLMVIMIKHEAALYWQSDDNKSDANSTNGARPMGQSQNGNYQGGNGTDGKNSDNGASNGAAQANGNGYKRPPISDQEKKNVEKIRRGPVWRIHSAFDGRFEKVRDRYKSNLQWVLANRLIAVIIFGVFAIISFCLLPFVGRDFFPSVDAGEILLHVRVPPSTRIEQTARIFSQVEADIRQTIPASELTLIMDNIGLAGSLNLAYQGTDMVGTSDGQITVSLAEKHHPTAGYVDDLRHKLQKDFPGVTFSFEPADIVSQILNFGLPAPIDVQISGPPTNQAKNYVIATKLLPKIAAVAGVSDAHLQEITDAPALQVNVDRIRAEQIGLTQQNVADSLLVSLAGTGAAAPDYWLDPKNGVQYNIVVQTPQYKLTTPEQLLDTPLDSPTSSTPQLLNNVATLTHTSTQVVISHYNIQPVYNIYASPDHRDLGSVSADIAKVLASIQKTLPRGSTTAIRGQVQDMNSSFEGLEFGLLGAVLLVYLLLVVNYQSWIDPLVAVSGAPFALCGIIWMLFVTQTTFSIPALMGAIMTIGVSTANSVLLVTFANEQRTLGMNAVDAVVEAGYVRMRPVIMTALAMIIGMLPMSLGLGEGGEQNAPLGRAVIGGLMVAIFSTLLFVPIAYSTLRRKDAVVDPDEENIDDYEPEAPGHANGSHDAGGSNDQGSQRGLTNVS